MIHTLDLGFLKQEKTIASYLVETDQGQSYLKRPHSTYPKLKLEIERVGFHVQDIKHVFLTHIHLDHAGAAWVFGDMGAKIYVHPKGLRHLASPEKLMSSAKRIYLDRMDELWGQMNPIKEENLVSCDDKFEVDFGNVKVVGWHTPGHAVHHIAWQMDDKLVAGDVAGVRINLGFIVPPCPPPDINIEDWKNSIELIKAMDLSEIYLTHFGKVTDIEYHLDCLEDILMDWANWMKPHFDAGNELADITPLFANYAAQQLRAFGLDEKGIAQYEAANPAWMSVAGLMRYWKKKQG